MFARIKNKNFPRYEQSLKKKDYYISKIDRKEKSFSWGIEMIVFL